MGADLVCSPRLGRSANPCCARRADQHLKVGVGGLAILRHHDPLLPFDVAERGTQPSRGPRGCSFAEREVSLLAAGERLLPFGDQALAAHEKQHAAGGCVELVHRPNRASELLAEAKLSTLRITKIPPRGRQPRWLIDGDESVPVEENVHRASVGRNRHNADRIELLRELFGLNVVRRASGWNATSEIGLFRKRSRCSNRPPGRQTQRVRRSEWTGRGIGVRATVMDRVGK